MKLSKNLRIARFYTIDRLVAIEANRMASRAEEWWYNYRVQCYNTWYCDRPDYAPVEHHTRDEGIQIEYPPMMWVSIGGAFILGWALGVGSWEALFSARMPPKIKREIAAWEDDNRPRMIITDDYPGYVRRFKERWELDDENHRMHPLWHSFRRRANREGGAHRADEVG